MTMTRCSRAAWCWCVSRPRSLLGRASQLLATRLCAPLASVVWTRGRFEPDLTPAIRRWFTEAGFAELSFVKVPDSIACVGAHRFTGVPRPFERGVRLFTFLERDRRPSQRSQGP